MSIFGWIGLGILFYFILSNHDKKMNKNFMNFLIRFEAIEHRVQELEILNDSQDNEIQDLKEKIRDLNERLFELEKPYRDF